MLRKKKYQEGLLTRTDGQLDNLQQLVQDLEFAQVEQEVVKGLKIGNDIVIYSVKYSMFPKYC